MVLVPYVSRPRVKFGSSVYLLNSMDHQFKLINSSDILSSTAHVLFELPIFLVQLILMRLCSIDLINSITSCLQQCVISRICCIIFYCFMIVIRTSAPTIVSSFLYCSSLLSIPFTVVHAFDICT